MPVLIYFVYLFVLGLLLAIYLAAELEIEGFQTTSSASGTYVSTSPLYVLNCSSGSCVSLGQDTDRLLYNQRLPVGGRLVSSDPGGRYVLTYANSGLLVLADTGAQTSGSGKVVLWQSRPQPKSLGRTPAYLVNIGYIMAVDSYGGEMNWTATPNPSSGSGSGSQQPNTSNVIPSLNISAGCYLQVTTYGDLVVLGASGATLWTANAGSPPPPTTSCVPDPAMLNYPYTSNDCYTIRSLINASRAYIGDLADLNPTNNLSSIVAAPAETPCAAGYYCPGGTGAPMPCSAGTYCPAGSRSETPCTAGNYCPAQATAQIRCTAGNYCPDGAGAPVPCTTDAGNYCPVGSTTAAGIACSFANAPQGKYCPGGARQALDCPPGSYCPGGPSPPLICPAATYCPGGSASPMSCNPSNTPPGMYCPAGAAAPVNCAAPAGQYCPGGSSQFAACPARTYCPGGATIPTKYACPPDIYTDLFNGTAKTTWFTPDTNNPAFCYQHKYACRGNNLLWDWQNPTCVDGLDQYPPTTDISSTRAIGTPLY